jgi:integrase
VGTRPSLIHAAIQRLDTKMAIGESRFAAKVAARAVDPALWSFSSGCIHSYGTRSSYQQHVLAFMNWCRATQGMRVLEHVDARSNELAVQYLSERMSRGQSAYTLQAIRSALRLFFDDRSLAADLPLPRRLREQITRSRRAVQRDTDFQPAHWQPLITFLRATGLRRAEVTVIRVRDVRLNTDGRAEVQIYSGKGGRARTVVARPGYEEAVVSVVKGRDPAARVFPRIPSHLDVHALRREFAQGLYQDLSGRPLPPSTGRLRSEDYDDEAVALVSRALGHNRLDVVLRHYLR